jgi:hypothetical protein
MLSLYEDLGYTFHFADAQMINLAEHPTVQHFQENARNHLAPPTALDFHRYIFSFSLFSFSSFLFLFFFRVRPAAPGPTHAAVSVDDRHGHSSSLPPPPSRCRWL